MDRVEVPPVGLRRERELFTGDDGGEGESGRVSQKALLFLKGCNSRTVDE